jgi:hypothetical protein
MKKALLSTLPLFALAGISPVFAQAPNTLPGLRLWLDAQDGATITTSAGLVTQWDDKSGNGFNATQADPARQPVVNSTAINGNQGVRFDGAAIFNSTDPNDDGMFINGLNVQRPYSIYMVSQYWGAIQSRTLQSLSTNWLLGNWNTQTSHYAGDGAGFVGPNVVTGTGNAVAHLGSGSFFDSTYTRNGDLNGRIGGGVNPGTIALGTPQTLVGPAGFPEPSQADIGEVLVYNRLLADNETRVVNNYLAGKWSLPRPNQYHASTQTVRFSGADSGEGLDFSGNFVAAVNMAGSAVTVGNAAFTPSSSPAANVSLNFVNTIGSGGWGAPNVGASADDAALNQVLNSINYSGAGVGNDLSGTVTGLTPGHAYKLQLLTWEACCTGRHFGVSVNGDPVKYAFEMAQHQLNPDSTLATSAGTALTHSFVSGSSSMTFALTAPDVAGGDLNAILNGFTLEDMGLAGVASRGAITNTASIDTTGTFAYALDFANSGGAKTVNGLTFQPAESASGVYIYAENFLEYNRPELGADADATALEDVLQSIRWEGFDGAGDNLSVDLGGIITGQQYKLTLLFSDSNSANRIFDININETQVEDDFSVGSVTLGDNAQGAFWTYEFTADSNELNILLDGGSVPGFGGIDRNPVLSGLMLEVVPEPGSVTLSGLAAAALLMRRRRRA